MKDVVHKQKVEHTSCIATAHILDAAYHLNDNHKAVTMMHWIYVHARVCVVWCFVRAMILKI